MLCMNNKKNVTYIFTREAKINIIIYIIKKFIYLN